MGERVGRCAIAAVLGLVVAGCSYEAPSVAVGSTTPSTSVPAPTTPPSTRTATGTPVAPASYPDSQQEYTSILVRAWGLGDRGKAGHYATAPALKKLFGATDRGGPSWSLIGCDNAGPWPACTFIDRRQKQRLVLFYDANNLGRPRAVLDLEFISDNPTLATQSSSRAPPARKVG